MNNKRRFLNAALASTLALSGLALNVSAEESTVIKRLGGDTRVETSKLVSDEAYDSAETVVIAGYEGEVDALTAAIIARQEKAPVLVVSDKDEDIQTVQNEIERLGATKAILLGDEQVVSSKVENALSDSVEIDRRGGHDRFDTAVKVAEEAGTSHEHVFLTNDGRSGELADALAVGPVSARDESPILLTSYDNLPTQTVEALKDLNVKEVTIIGGKNGAVSKKVEDELKKDYDVDRIAGPTREETAIAIAERYFGDSDEVVLANDGRISYADAVVGGYFGEVVDAPLLLTHQHKLPKGTKNYLGENATFAYVLGSEPVVSADVASSVEQIILDNAVEELTVESVSAIDATTIEVTFEGVEEPVKIELDEALVHGENEVTFTYEDQEFTVTVDYVDPVVELEELEAAIKEAAEEELAELKEELPELEKDVIDAKAARDKAKAEFDAINSDEDATNAQKGAAKDKLEAAKKDLADAQEAVADNKARTKEIEEKVLPYVDRLAAAEKAVENAEELLTDAAVEEANTKISALPNGTEKTALKERLADIAEDVAVNQERLDLKEAVEEEIANVESNLERKDIAGAKFRLEKAEEALENVKDEDDKAELQGKIDDLKAAIEEAENDAAVEVVEGHLAAIESNLEREDVAGAKSRYESAEKALEDVTNEDDKAALQEKLDDLKAAIEEAGKVTVETQEELEDALADAGVTEITLDADIEVDSTLKVINDGVTIDGAGHKLSGGGTNQVINAVAIEGLTIKNVVFDNAKALYVESFTGDIEIVENTFKNNPGSALILDLVASSEDLTDEQKDAATVKVENNDFTEAKGNLVRDHHGLYAEDIIANNEFGKEVKAYEEDVRPNAVVVKFAGEVKAAEVNKLISRFSKNVEVDYVDKVYIKAVEAAKEAYDELTEEEQAFVGENNKEKLEAAIKKIAKKEVADAKIKLDSMEESEESFEGTASSVRSEIVETIDNDNITVTVSKSTGNQYLVKLTHKEVDVEGYSKVITITAPEA